MSPSPGPKRYELLAGELERIAAALREVQRAPSPAESPFGVVLSPENGYRPEPVNADAETIEALADEDEDE